MDIDLTKTYLNNRFPHVTNTIPASTIATFSTVDNCNIPVKIAANTPISIPTTQQHALKMRTCYDLDVFPFIYEEVCENQIFLENMSDNFNWSQTDSFTLYILDNNIELLNDILKSEFHIESHYDSMPARAILPLRDSRDTPYDLLNDYCNIPHLLFYVHIIPLEDFTITAKRFTLTFNTPLFKLNTKPKLAINSVLCENRFTIQSEPIRISKDQTIYPIQTDTHIANKPPQLLTDIKSFSLDPEISDNKHGHIISLPIECHQNDLYEDILQYSAEPANKPNDQIKNISIQKVFSAPIEPRYPYDAVSALDILFFDYINNDKNDHTKLLVQFIRYHLRIKENITQDLLHSIMRVLVNPSQVSELTYFISFFEVHPYIDIFCNVLQSFFMSHRPVNTKIRVEYETL
jgi:hypothetical protein